jgi:DNA-binding beta-propeller fold protein YncE
MSLSNVSITTRGEEIVVLLTNYSGTKKRIDVLSREGKVLRSLELKEFRGHPSGVAVTRAGDFVVADKENGRIVVFDKFGGSVRASDAGALFRPSALSVDGEGRIYVADMRKHRVVVFNEAGVVLRRLGDAGTLSPHGGRFGHGGLRVCRRLG